MRSKLNRGANKVQTPDQVLLGTELFYLIKVHLYLKYAFFEGGTLALCVNDNSQSMSLRLSRMVPF